jgi:hypothetical protein
MAKQDKYVAILEDENDDRWIYEGSVQGIPIWTPESQAKPKFLSEDDAYTIVHKSRVNGDTGFVEIRA